MRLDTDVVLAQIDALLAEWQVDPGSLPSWAAFEHVPGTTIAQRTTRLMALLERFTVLGSRYRKAAQEPFDLGWQSDSASTFVHVLGVVAALRADVEDGYLQSIQELIHADLFADFLEMAAELQEKGFKDPAAVVAGSVLEEHLRKLANVSGVASENPAGSPKKADTLNAELAKAEVYNKLVQKSVTAWLGLRNSAAHGQYGDYDEKQVAALIRDVRNFLVAYPA